MDIGEDALAMLEEMILEDEEIDDQMEVSELKRGVHVDKR